MVFGAERGISLGHAHMVQSRCEVRDALGTHGTCAHTHAASRKPHAGPAVPVALARLSRELALTRTPQKSERSVRSSVKHWSSSSSTWPESVAAATRSISVYRT